MEEDKETINEDIEETAEERVTNTYEKLKAANDKVEKEMLRQEELKAKIAIGGKSEAGQETVIKEETPEDYVAKVMSGDME